MIYCVNPVHPVQKKEHDIELIGGEHHVETLLRRFRHMSL